MVRVGLLALIASRIAWTAWRYYFGGAPRYPLESAAIALVLVGLFVVLLRHAPPFGESDSCVRGSALPLITLPAFIVAALALYARVMTLGFLSDDYVVRESALTGRGVVAVGGFVRPLPLAVWRAVLALSDSPV